MIVEVGKRKPVEQFTLHEEEDIEKYSEMKKNIKNLLSRFRQNNQDT